jgi:ubiquinone/menaquinone biosynthesis C-methylase UbiE
MKMSRLQRLYVNSSLHSEIKTDHIGQVLEPGELERAGTVLEIGCGSGVTAEALNSRYGMDVVGLDVDPVQIKLAMKQRGSNERLRFVEADATAMPFDAGTFDLVVSLMVLHHILDWSRVIAEAARVLRPEGMYVLYDLVYGRLPRMLAAPVLKSHGFFSIEEVIDRSRLQGLRVVRELEPINYYLRQFTRFTLVLRKD